MKKLIPLLIALSLFGCGFESRKNDKSALSYFSKKVECQKYENEIQRNLSKNVDMGVQSLERIFYSPSLDTCVSAVYFLHPDGKIGADITDVLTEKQLWHEEYPPNSNKSYEIVMSDVDRKIEEMGWEKAP
jgi:hypothetical protein